MSPWTGALKAEFRKAGVSRAPWLLGLAGCALAAIATLFMIILKDPEGARKLGLLGAKAELSGLTADWPSYFSLLNQALAVGFLFLSALFTTWLFGREFSDGTAKLLMAVPAGRGRVVVAKFAVSALWAAASIVIIGAAGLLGGAVVNLPGGGGVEDWAATFAAVGVLTWVLSPWVAFSASVGRGYLAPLAFTLVTVAVANLGAVLGWGEVVPWAIPSLVAGSAGPDTPGWPSLVFVVATGAAGLAATVAFWTRADHPR